MIEVSKNLKISINKFEKQHVMESMKFSDGGMGATLGKPGIGTGAFKIPQNDSVPDSNYHSRQGSNMDLEKVYHKAIEPKIKEYELKEEIDDMPVVIFGKTAYQL